MALYDPPIEPQPRELNLDTGSKKSIANSVASSPQRYSTAFSSRAPRLSKSMPRSPDCVYLKPQSAVQVKEPYRKHVIFRSSIARFESNRSGMFSRGMHPNMQMAQVRKALCTARRAPAAMRPCVVGPHDHPRNHPL